MVAVSFLLVYTDNGSSLFFYLAMDHIFSIHCLIIFTYFSFPIRIIIFSFSVIENDNAKNTVLYNLNTKN
ncbi:hypothetical protein AQUCO_07200052v1 [Aquilegia coerulea]|uniref:Uncharacterized protein n=1 Tax=Aquilegia coerulea TaxID=218851 RepID=A0A2G5CA54_AQUCA|nr:hypothetical protein AQUCO_07200052v1 [Aquilegia coerulea]